MGESAALLFTAGSGYMPRNWLGKVMEPGGTLTIQLYLFMQKAKYNEAFGVAVVLLAIVLAINGLARYLSRKLSWRPAHRAGGGESRGSKDKNFGPEPEPVLR